MPVHAVSQRREARGRLTLDQVGDFLLVAALVEGADGVVDGLAEDGGEALAHGGIGERVLMVASVYILTISGDQWEQ
jgi:hypothetical protein